MQDAERWSEYGSRSKVFSLHWLWRSIYDKKHNANYCSQACKIQGRYQSRFDVKREHSRHENMNDILHIQKLAREEGLTYGQYVAKHRLYGSEVFKKK